MGQGLDRAFALEAVRVTEAAAISAAKQIGRGDEKAAGSCGRRSHAHSLQPAVA
jgi:fructose-1,6-bisphosphatase/sedoheptulose 1,7-bisphosphatase-like protein